MISLVSNKELFCFINRKVSCSCGKCWPLFSLSRFYHDHFYMKYVFTFLPDPLVLECQVAPHISLLATCLHVCLSETKAWFPYRCICRICRVCRTKKIHRTDRIHSISYNKFYLSFLLYWAFVREVSIKLYLSYEFFSYDRYNDMETRLYKRLWFLLLEKTYYYIN